MARSLRAPFVPAHYGVLVKWFDVAAVLARLIVGGVWIVAGLLKLPDPAGSVRAVRAYDLLPEAVVPTVGHALPAVEVVVGLALVVGLLTRGMAVVSAALLVAFVVGIASAWARGLQIECGCFGDGGYAADASAAYPWEIARDLALVALSALVAAVPARLALDGVLLGSTRSRSTAQPTPDLIED